MEMARKVLYVACVVASSNLGTFAQILCSFFLIIIYEVFVLVFQPYRHRAHYRLFNICQSALVGCLFCFTLIEYENRQSVLFAQHTNALEQQRYEKGKQETFVGISAALIVLLLAPLLMFLGEVFRHWREDRNLSEEERLTRLAGVAAEIVRQTVSKSKRTGSLVNRAVAQAQTELENQLAQRSRTSTGSKSPRSPKLTEVQPIGDVASSESKDQGGQSSPRGLSSAVPNPLGLTVANPLSEKVDIEV